MAENGAAIQIQDLSRVRPLFDLCAPAFMSCFQVDLSNTGFVSIQRNSALVRGGAIFTDDSSSSVTAVEYTHKLAESALGPCFLQFGDEFEIVKVCPLIAIAS